jgi:predicted HTH domain antitoxin
MNFLLRFLPRDKVAMLTLAMRITSSLDTREEREAAIEYGIEMLSDGKVSVSEWAKFGSALGILTGKH